MQDGSLGLYLSFELTTTSLCRLDPLPQVLQYLYVVSQLSSFLQSLRRQMEQNGLMGKYYWDNSRQKSTLHFFRLVASEQSYKQLKFF